MNNTDNYISANGGGLQINKLCKSAPGSRNRPGKIVVLDIPIKGQLEV